MPPGCACDMCLQVGPLNRCFTMDLGSRYAWRNLGLCSGPLIHTLHVRSQDVRFHVGVQVMR